MQVTAGRPISDRESTTLAVNKWFANTATAGYLEDLDEMLASYNSDRTFRDLARDFYYELAEEPTYEDDEEDFQEPLGLSHREIAAILGAVAALAGAVRYGLARRVRP